VGGNWWILELREGFETVNFFELTEPRAHCLTVALLRCTMMPAGCPVVLSLAEGRTERQDATH
jgi:hypothetical protein